MTQNSIEPNFTFSRGWALIANLVEGDEVVVESPDDSFEPFLVHYAGTFIVPAAVGKYTIRPSRKTLKPFGTIKAFVRTSG